MATMWSHDARLNLLCDSSTLECQNVFQAFQILTPRYCQDTSQGPPQGYLKTHLLVGAPPHHNWERLLFAHWELKRSDPVPTKRNLVGGQWLFSVPIKGGSWHIIPQLAVYTTYIYIYMRVVLNSFMWKTPSSPKRNFLSPNFSEPHVYL